MWMYGSIVERLRGTPARVEERIMRVPGPMLLRRQGDAWSIQQNIGHLWDVEQLWAQRTADLKNGKETISPADQPRFSERALVHNERQLDEVLAGFRAARAQFVSRLESADDQLVARSAFHQRLQGHMRLIDLAFFAAEHDDYHLAKITELLRADQA
jgi:uncharacterized damage-inducible protein DinB